MNRSCRFKNKTISFFLRLIARILRFNLFYRVGPMPAPHCGFLAVRDGRCRVVLRFFFLSLFFSWNCFRFSDPSVHTIARIGQRRFRSSSAIVVCVHVEWPLSFAATATATRLPTDLLIIPRYNSNVCGTALCTAYEKLGYEIRYFFYFFLSNETVAIMSFT